VAVDLGGYDSTEVILKFVLKFVFVTVCQKEASLVGAKSIVSPVLQPQRNCRSLFLFSTEDKNLFSVDLL